VEIRTGRLRRRAAARAPEWTQASRPAVRCGGLLVPVCLAGCGGGGGGGGGGSGPIRHSPGFFESEEYFANRGLEALGASSGYAAGGTGDSILVGVIDTGIDRDHPEFAGVIDGDSIDIVTGDAAALDDVDGTAVAGVIAARRNGALAHGVAFDARLLVIRADEPGSCPGLRVRPAGCGRGDRLRGRPWRPGDQLQSRRRLAEWRLARRVGRCGPGGRIVVLAAGNDGGDDPIVPAIFAGAPEARARAIAVGALDADGTLASFSNKAGSAKRFFLIAPGVQILAPLLDGDAALVSGTSFAAPHVTGAAALLLEAAPHLSAKEVVALLLETATDLGASGTDDVYGRGALNLAAALAPQGPLTIPLGASADEAGAALPPGCASAAHSARDPTSDVCSSSTATAGPIGSISTSGARRRRSPRTCTAGSLRRAQIRGVTAMRRFAAMLSLSTAFVLVLSGAGSADDVESAERLLGGNENPRSSRKAPAASRRPSWTTGSRSR
jgi:Subtilase family